jgi:hypothetical protein
LCSGCPEFIVNSTRFCGYRTAMVLLKDSRVSEWRGDTRVERPGNGGHSMQLIGPDRDSGVAGLARHSFAIV